LHCLIPQVAVGDQPHFMDAPRDSTSTASIATVRPRRKSLCFMETTPCLIPGPPPRRTPRPVDRQMVRSLYRCFVALDGRSIAVRRRRWLGGAVSQSSRARADHDDVLIGLLFLACVASVPLAGGRLAALAELRFRAVGLLVAAIAAQVLIVTVFPQE